MKKVSENPDLWSIDEKTGPYVAECPNPSDEYKILVEKDLTKIAALQCVDDALNAGAKDVEISTPRPTDEGSVPLDEIVEAFNNQTVIPFLGAGVPLSARTTAEPWSLGCNFLPSAAELARFIARRCSMPVHHMRDSSNLARVASYYSAITSNDRLAMAFDRIFAAGKPAPIHVLLAKQCRRPKLIVTTNYDTLMEKAFTDVGRKFDRVIHFSSDANKGQAYVWKWEWERGEFVDHKQLDDLLKPDERTVIYKIHGSFDIPRPASEPKSRYRDNRFVITEEHYVDFLSRIHADPPIVPPFFTSFFRGNSFFFLGYSLEDWNLRVILHSLRSVLPSPAAATRPAPAAGSVADELGMAPRGVADRVKVPEDNRNPHWAIQKDPTKYDSKIWDSRGVTIGNRDLNKFVAEICNPEVGLLPPDDLPVRPAAAQIA